MLRSMKGQKRIRKLKVNNEGFEKICLSSLVVTPTIQKPGTKLKDTCHNCGFLYHYVPTLEERYDFRNNLDKLVEKIIFDKEKSPEKIFQLSL